jgi:2-iminobutanoate/2-iminopropanoate deaminase
LKTIVTSRKAPEPVGPYNQAVKTGGLVFTSGQIPLDIVTGEVCARDIRAQTRRVLEYARALLEEAGSGLDRVVKATVFLKDLEDFARMNEVYAEFFPAATAPARSCVEVSRLPRDVLVEIEVVAAL